MLGTMCRWSVSGDPLLLRLYSVVFVFVVFVVFAVFAVLALGSSCSLQFSLYRE